MSHEANWDKPSLGRGNASLERGGARLWAVTQSPGRVAECDGTCRRAGDEAWEKPGSRLCWVCVSEMVLWPSLCFPLKRIFHFRDATLLKWMYKQAMNIFYIYIHMSRITVPHFNDQLSAPKWMTVWIGKPYVMFHTLILNSNIWGSDVCGLGFTKASFLWTVEEKPPQVSFPVNTTINSLSILINWL